MGVLSWLIEEGSADETDLAGLPVALASRYSDDEQGSPWTWILYLDSRRVGSLLSERDLGLLNAFAAQRTRTNGMERAPIQLKTIPKGESA